MTGLATIPRQAAGSGRTPFGPRPHTGRPRMRPSGRMAHRARGVAPDPELVEAIAARVVELLEREERPTREPRYIDAAALASEYDVDRDWVYAHKAELGAIRLLGPQGRLRFDRLEIPGRLERLTAAGEKRPPRPAKRRGRPGGRGSLKPGFRMPGAA